MVVCSLEKLLDESSIERDTASLTAEVYWGAMDLISDEAWSVLASILSLVLSLIWLVSINSPPLSFFMLLRKSFADNELDFLTIRLAQISPKDLNLSFHLVANLSVRAIACSLIEASIATPDTMPTSSKLCTVSVVCIEFLAVGVLNNLSIWLETSRCILVTISDTSLA